MYTLLDMTQHILSALDSDEVNTIGETTESLQVAEVIRGVYYDLAADLDLPEHETLIELTASGSLSQPTVMYIPTNTKQIKWVKYNHKLDTETNPNYKDVEYVDLAYFLQITQGMRGNTLTGSQNVVVNSETFDFVYRTDKMPSYYTSLNDSTLVFDSYDSDIDDTLQKSKTMCMAKIIPDFTMSDNFTPLLNKNQFALLRNKAKNRAFIELKQMENADAARETRRQRIITQYQKRRSQGVEEIYKVPRYGRR